MILKPTSAEGANSSRGSVACFPRIILGSTSSESAGNAFISSYSCEILDFAMDLTENRTLLGILYDVEVSLGVWSR